MRDADLNKLYPPVKEMFEKGIALAHAQGLYAYPFEVYRDSKRQAQLYAQGRTTPGQIVSWAKPGLSYHEYGLAVDLVFDSDLRKPGPQWTWTGDYFSLAKVMRSVGIETISKEQAHFQKSYGIRTFTLKQIKDKHGLKGVWNFLDNLLSRKLT